MNRFIESKFIEFMTRDGLQARVVHWLKRLLAAYICLVYLAVGCLLAHILHWPFPLVMTLWAPLALIVAIALMVGSILALLKLLTSKKRPHVEQDDEA